MKPYFHPIPIVALVFAGVAAVLSNIPLMVLALIVGIAAMGLLAARGSATARSTNTAESLSAESRTLLRPIRKLSEDIRSIVAANESLPTIKIIGGEALSGADKLTSQVIHSLSTRDELKRSLRNRYEAEKEIREATMRLEFATATEKASLESAIEARKQELAHYDEIERQLKQIESHVNQAEAALAEIKARLSVSASSDKAALGPDEDLRESIARMRNLSASYDEADQVVRGS